MQIVTYILVSVAAVLLIIAVPVITARALILMARLEETRRDLSGLIAEGQLSLQHTNRVLQRTGDGADHLRRTVERLDKMLALLQPAASVGGLLAGAKRVITGRTGSPETPSHKEREGER